MSSIQQNSLEKCLLRLAQINHTIQQTKESEITYFEEFNNLKDKLTLSIKRKIDSETNEQLARSLSSPCPDMEKIVENIVFGKNKNEDVDSGICFDKDLLKKVSEILLEFIETLITNEIISDENEDATLFVTEYLDLIINLEHDSKIDFLTNLTKKFNFDVLDDYKDQSKKIKLITTVLEALNNLDSIPNTFADFIKSSIRFYNTLQLTQSFPDLNIENFDSTTNEDDADSIEENPFLLDLFEKACLAYSNLEKQQEYDFDLTSTFLEYLNFDLTIGSETEQIKIDNDVIFALEALSNQQIQSDFFEDRKNKISLDQLIQFLTQKPPVTFCFTNLTREGNAFIQEYIRHRVGKILINIDTLNEEQNEEIFALLQNKDTSNYGIMILSNHLRKQYKQNQPHKTYNRFLSFVMDQKLNRTCYNSVIEIFTSITDLYGDAWKDAIPRFKLEKGALEQDEKKDTDPSLEDKKLIQEGAKSWDNLFSRLLEETPEENAKKIHTRKSKILNLLECIFCSKQDYLSLMKRNIHNKLTRDIYPQFNIYKTLSADITTEQQKKFTLDLLNYYDHESDVYLKGKIEEILQHNIGKIRTYLQSAEEWSQLAKELLYGSYELYEV